MLRVVGPELTQATAAVRRGRVALGTRAAEGAGEVLAPAGRAGAALGALVHICGEEGWSQTLSHRSVRCAGVGVPYAPDGETSIAGRPRPHPNQRQLPHLGGNSGTRPSRLPSKPRPLTRSGTQIPPSPRQAPPPWLR